MSVRSTSADGLLSRSNPYGTCPPSSPASSASGTDARSSTAASIVGTGRHRRPSASAVTSIVVVRYTSTATIVYGAPYNGSRSGKQSTTTERSRVVGVFTFDGGSQGSDRA